MADLHQVLAPLIEPPVLTGVAMADASAVPWPSVGLALLAILALLLVVVRLWHRRAPSRALKHIANQSDPTLAAHQLAQLLSQHGKPLPADWLAKLDHVRFGQPAAEHTSTLARLCVEARTFIQPR
jgi:hypothetical protein